MISFIIGFIIGVTATTYTVKKSIWTDYKHDDYVMFNIIVVRYRNDDLFVTRDRNDINWDEVKSYIKL